MSSPAGIRASIEQELDQIFLLTDEESHRRGIAKKKIPESQPQIEPRKPMPAAAAGTMLSQQ